MMSSKIFFKDASLEEQFFRRLDPRLRAICYDVAEFCERRFKKQWIVTDVNRDDPQSAHGYGRAVDCRSFHLTEEEVKIVIKYLDSVWGADTAPLNKRTDTGRNKFLRVLHHKVDGNEYHFHIAINSSHARGDYAGGVSGI